MGSAQTGSLVLLMAALALGGCAQTSRPGVIMAGQSLAAMSDEDLCRTYRWRGPYGSGDTQLVREEVGRRGVACGTAGSAQLQAAELGFRSPTGLLFVLP